MNKDEIKKLVYQLLKQIAPDTEPSTLQADENIREVLDIDSFDSLQFLVSLNQKLGIEIPEEDYGKITTMKTLVNYILEKLKHKGKCL